MNGQEKEPSPSDPAKHAEAVRKADAKLRLMHHDMYQRISIHASNQLDEISRTISAAAAYLDSLTPLTPATGGE